MTNVMNECAIFLQMTKITDFSQWLQSEIDQRGWSQAEFSKKSGVNSGLLSRILSGERSPGVETCRAIAKTFGMKEIQILKIAGLVNDSDLPKFSPLVEAAAAMLNDLPEEDQEELRAMIRVKWERAQRKRARRAEVKP